MAAAVRRIGLSGCDRKSTTTGAYSMQPRRPSNVSPIQKVSARLKSRMPR